MATVTVNDESLTAIADAIREKLDVETTYLPSQMAAAIGSIDTSGTELTSADEGKVVVESSGEYVLQAQTSRNISQDGTYDTTTNDEVVVSVQGSGSDGGGSYMYTLWPSSGLSSNVRTAGFKFSLQREAKVTKVLVYGDASTESIYISNDSENVLAIIDEQLTTGALNEVVLDEPLTLEPNVEYLAWKSVNTSPKYTTGYSFVPSVLTSAGLYIIDTYTGTTMNTPPSTSASYKYVGLDLYLV